MIQGLVPNIKCLNGEELEIVYRARRGRLLKVPPLKTVTPRFSTQLENSFMTKDPRLFNCLPQGLRAVEFTFDTFKKKLGLSLFRVQDKPVLPHYYQTFRNNSLVEQIGHVKTAYCFFFSLFANPLATSRRRQLVREQRRRRQRRGLLHLGANYVYRSTGI